MQHEALFQRLADLLSRQWLGRELSREESTRLRREIEAALADAGAKPAGPSHPACPRAVGQAGIALIKRFEGMARVRKDGLVEAYPDPGSGGAPWTIGWGSTGEGIGPATVWTAEQCEQRFQRDLARHAQAVAEALGAAPTSQHQFDALVSFDYNTGALHRSTLLRKHKAGDFEGAAREFSRWVFAGGRKLRGLEKRRAAEAALYRGPQAASVPDQ